MKSDLLYFIEEFERVIEASFNSSLHLENVDIELFKKMYPNFSNNMFSIKDKKDVEMIGEMFGIFRRLNAHAIPSISDVKYLKNFDVKKCRLQTQKVFNENIKYVADDGKLSLAGLVFIILNLGREQSIESLVKKNSIISFISNRKKEIDGKIFVNEISHVNLTNPIREDNKDSIESSILGDMIHKFVLNPNNVYSYELLRGNEIYQCKIDVAITENHIFVKGGSLTNVYYENDYDLEIVDKDHFIELANLFPPFTFVDLLYKLDIHTFDNKKYEYIIEEKNWERFSKLRFPKFYIDKNIDILLADEKHADIRINSNVCNGAMTAIFLRLEKSLIKYNHVNIGDFDYSKVNKLLEMVGCTKELCEKTRLIRNLISHCAIIGEYCVSTSGAYQFTFDNIIEYLIELLDFFKRSEQTEIYETLRKDVSNLFIGQIISIRTKLFSREVVKMLGSYPTIENLADLKIKRKFYDNTSYSVETFNLLNEIVYGEPRLIIFTLNEIDFELVLYINDDNLVAFNNFVTNNSFEIVDDRSAGMIRYIKLQKQR